MTKNVFLKWFIVVIDLVYLWNIHEFFTISSTFLNYTGVGLLLLLTLLTIKIFKK